MYVFVSVARGAWAGVDFFGYSAERHPPWRASYKSRGTQVMYYTSSLFLSVYKFDILHVNEQRLWDIARVKRVEEKLYISRVSISVSILHKSDD